MNATALSDMFIGVFRAIYAALVGGAALYFLVTQRFSLFIQWAVVAIAVGIFVYFPDVIIGAGEAIATALTSE